MRIPASLSIVAAAATGMLLVAAAQADSRREATAPARPSGAHPSPYAASTRGQRAATVYALQWGVDDMHVKLTSQGVLARFTYRVVDADKAKVLADKRATPHLLNPRNHAELQVPVMEKIGELRQTSGIENGKDYWMVFSNKGNYVRPGDHVDVVIGAFHVEGLVVE